MGPTIVLDKSALQALSAEEITVLGKYYIVCHTPILISEVLADLSKSGDFSKPTSVVKTNARKFVECGFSMPCVSARQLVEAELRGAFQVPMNGQIPVAEGKSIVSKSGTTGILFGKSSVEAAISAWQRGEFSVSEHRFASGWRETTRNVDLEKLQHQLSEQVGGGSIPQQPRDLMRLIDNILLEPRHQTSLIGALIQAGRIGHVSSREIFSRWHVGGFREIRNFSPYAFHCLRIFLFFAIGLSLKCPFIGTRSTNLLDLEYFFYTPLCNVFVSADKFHKKLAPLFVGQPRMFVCAEELKADLARISDYIAAMGPSERAHSAPPSSEESVTFQAWKRFMRTPANSGGNVLTRMSQQEKDNLTTRVRELYRDHTVCDEVKVASDLAENPGILIRKTQVDLNGICECGSRRLRRDCCYSELA